ncbi:DivIVA domain-containing protein [bacterium]|nr:DivIVA domain-containing protein [bacterium]
MGLTPLDAEKYEFPSGFRGYDRNAVEQFRALVVQALEGHIQESAGFRRRISELEDSLAELRGKEGLIQTSMMTAQKTGEDIVANAREEAGMIRARAEADCQDLRNELARLRAEREEFEYAFHGLLAGFLHRLEKGNPSLVGQDSAEAASQLAPLASAAAQAAAAVHPPAADLDQLLDETGQAEPEVQATESADKWIYEPEQPRIRSSRSVDSERDADHTDFSRVLDEASDAPPLAGAGEQPAAGMHDAMHSHAADRDMDEDADLMDEIQHMEAEREAAEQPAWQSAGDTSMDEMDLGVWRDDEYGSDDDEEEEDAVEEPAGLDAAGAFAEIGGYPPSVDELNAAAEAEVEDAAVDLWELDAADAAEEEADLEDAEDEEASTAAWLNAELEELDDPIAELQSTLEAAPVIDEYDDTPLPGIVEQRQPSVEPESTDWSPAAADEGSGWNGNGHTEAARGWEALEPEPELEPAVIEDTLEDEEQPAPYEPPMVSDPNDYQVPDVMQASAAGDSGEARSLPPSNLDEIFGGIPSAPPPEDDEDDAPYRADW